MADKRFQGRDKIVQKMTKDGLVEENLRTGETAEAGRFGKRRCGKCRRNPCCGRRGVHGCRGGRGGKATAQHSQTEYRVL